MSTKPTYTSSQLVAMIQEGGVQKTKAIAYIFRHNQKKTLTYLKGKGASEMQADDLLQEGMLILIRKLEKGDFEAKNQATVHTYFVGICKNLLRAEQRKKVYTEPMVEGQDFSEDDLSITHSMEQNELQHRLHIALKKLSDVCRQMLLLRAETPPVPWQELALEFGYKDAQNAMNKGGKCMKKLRLLYANK